MVRPLCGRGGRRLPAGCLRECLLHAGLGLGGGFGRGHVVDEDVLQHVGQDQLLVDGAQLGEQQRRRLRRIPDWARVLDDLREVVEERPLLPERRLARSR